MPNYIEKVGLQIVPQLDDSFMNDLKKDTSKAGTDLKNLEKEIGLSFDRLVNTIAADGKTAAKNLANMYADMINGVDFGKQEKAVFQGYVNRIDSLLQNNKAVKADIEKAFKEQLSKRGLSVGNGISEVKDDFKNYYGEMNKSIEIIVNGLRNVALAAEDVAKSQEEIRKEFRKTDDVAKETSKLLVDTFKQLDKKQSGDFLKIISDGFDKLDDNAKAFLNTLGLIDKKGNLSLPKNLIDLEDEENEIKDFAKLSESQIEDLVNRIRILLNNGFDIDFNSLQYDKKGGFFISYLAKAEGQAESLDSAIERLSDDLYGMSEIASESGNSGYAKFLEKLADQVGDVYDRMQSTGTLDKLIEEEKAAKAIQEAQTEQAKETAKAKEKIADAAKKDTSETEKAAEAQAQETKEAKETEKAKEQSAEASSKERAETEKATEAQKEQTEEAKKTAEIKEDAANSENKEAQKIEETTKSIEEQNQKTKDSIKEIINTEEKIQAAITKTSEKIKEQMQAKKDAEAATTSEPVQEQEKLQSAVEETVSEYDKLIQKSKEFLEAMTKASGKNLSDLVGIFGRDVFPDEIEGRYARILEIITKISNGKQITSKSNLDDLSQKLADEITKLNESVAKGIVESSDEVEAKLEKEADALENATQKQNENAQSKKKSEAAIKAEEAARKEEEQSIKNAAKALLDLDDAEEKTSKDSKTKKKTDGQKEYKKSVDNTNKSLEEQKAAENKGGTKNTSSLKNIEAERQEFEKLKDSINDVQKAVNGKTIKIEEERNAVDKAVNSEISKFGELAGAIDRVKNEAREGYVIPHTQNENIETNNLNAAAEAESLARLKSALEEIQTLIRGKNELFYSEQNIVNSLSASEANDLKKIEDAILSICTEIMRKNDLFTEEARVVAEAVNTEINSLRELDGQIAIIQGRLESLNSSPIKIIAGQQNIDFSLNTEELKPQIERLNEIVEKIKDSFETINNLKVNSKGLTEIINLLNKKSAQNINEVKLNGSLGNNIKKVVDATQNVSGAKLEKLLTFLQGLAKVKLDSVGKNLSEIGKGIKGFISEVSGASTINDLTKVLENIKLIQKEIKEVQKENKGNKKSNIGANTISDEDTANVNKYIKALKDRSRLEEKYQKNKAGFGNMSADDVATYKQAVNYIESIGHSLDGVIEKNVSWKNEINEIKAKYIDIQNVAEQNVQDLVNSKANDEYIKQLENARKAVSKVVGGKYLKDDVETAANYIERLDTVINNLKANKVQVVSPEQADMFKKLSDGAINFKTKLDEINAKAANLQKVENYIKQTNQALRDNGSWSRAARDSIKSYISQMRQLADDSKLTTGQFNQLRNAIEQLQAAEAAAGRGGRTFFQNWGNQLVHLNAQFLAMHLSMMDIIRYGREMATNVINIDTALTELRKVSDASNDRIQQSFEKSAETARELGQTITDVINSTSDWARNGFNISDSEELARVSTLYQNVGDNISQEDATQTLVSTLRGFQMDVEEAEHIVDVVNQTSNNMAISSAGIGEALQRSAAALNVGNTSFEQSTALISGINEIAQDPDKVGVCPTI